MTVISGADWYGVFCTKDATGLLAAPGVGPVAALWVDGVATGVAVAINGANPYSWDVTLPALTNGQCVSIYITATIGGIATASVVAEDVVSEVYVSSRGTADPGDAMALTAVALAQIVAGISAILCNVWNCARRTLTMPITLLKSMLRGEKLELLRGDTLDLPILALGDLTTATELWFTVKKQLSDPDTASEIQISLTGGLLAIAGAPAATPANGSITIDDLAAGNVTIALTAEEMAKLDIDFVGYWDIQKAVGVVATTLTRGNAQVLGDSTRSVA